MKEKILAQLKTKYKNLGVSDKVLEGIAEMLAVTTTEEGNIETAVGGVETLLKGFQSDADKRVTDAVAKVKQPKAPEAPEPPKDEPPKETKDDDMPAWAKTLLTKVEAFETSKVSSTRKQILEQKLEKANPTLKAKILKDFERMSFETDEDFTAYVTETETDLGELLKVENEQSLGALGRPFSPSGNTKTEASKEEVTSIVNEIMQ